MAFLRVVDVVRDGLSARDLGSHPSKLCPYRDPQFTFVQALALLPMRQMKLRV